MFVCDCVGFRPSCPHSSPPVLREKDGGSVGEDKNGEEGGVLREEKKKEESLVSLTQHQQQQQRFLSTARGLFQGNASTQGHGASSLSTVKNRRRIFSLEPFHQSSIASSRLKREREDEREDEREEEDRTGPFNKKFISGNTLSFFQFWHYSKMYSIISWQKFWVCVRKWFVCEHSLDLCRVKAVTRSDLNMFHQLSSFICYLAIIFIGCCFTPEISLVLIHHRLDSGGREEAEGLHRTEWPQTEQAPPPWWAQPMAALQPEVGGGWQEVQSGRPGHQGEVGGRRRLVEGRPERWSQQITCFYWNLICVRASNSFYFNKLFT